MPGRLYIYQTNAASCSLIEAAGGEVFMLKMHLSHELTIQIWSASLPAN